MRNHKCNRGVGYGEHQGNASAGELGAESRFGQMSRAPEPALGGSRSLKHHLYSRCTILGSAGVHPEVWQNVGFPTPMRVAAEDSQMFVRVCLHHRDQHVAYNFDQEKIVEYDATCPMISGPAAANRSRTILALAATIRLQSSRLRALDSQRGSDGGCGTPRLRR